MVRRSRGGGMGGECRYLGGVCRGVYNGGGEEADEDRGEVMGRLKCWVNVPHDICKQLWCGALMSKQAWWREVTDIRK